VLTKAHDTLRIVQRIASLLVGGAVFAGVAWDAGATAGPPLVLWHPQGAGAVGEGVRAALEREAKARGCRLVAAPVDAAAEHDSPSLAEALVAAVADYRAFKFAAAVAKLDRLAATAQASGGDELDVRQLAELYLYRGLSRSELLQNDAAWDDFVRAARLDPARVLDPAQFPPRAVAAYRRAVADAVALPLANVRVLAPAGARVRVDGREVTGAIAVPLGTHLLRVRAAGFQPFGGAIDVTASDERITPPLIPLRAPPADKLVALAGGPPALVAVVETALHVGGATSGDEPAGTRVRAEWRLSVRAVATDGNARLLERAIDADSAAPAAAALVHQLLDAPTPSLLPAPSAVATQPRGRRMPAWSWGVIGGAAAIIAIIVPIAIIYGQSSPQGTIGGNIGPLQ
jgi:hypothetical protein